MNESISTLSPEAVGEYEPYQYTKKPFSAAKPEDKEIIRGWVKSEAKTVVVPPLAETRETRDPNIEVELRVNPKSTKLAYFRPAKDRMEIGDGGNNLSEGITTALLRHERSHAYFFNLPVADQAVIVDTLVTNDTDALLEMYEMLVKTSPPDYFSYAAAESLKSKMLANELIPPYTRYLTVTQDGEERAINAALIVNELIAYSVTMKSDREYVDFQEHINWQTHFQRALEMREHTLSAQSKAVIQKYGFQNIRASDLYQKLIDQVADQIVIYKN